MDQEMYQQKRKSIEEPEGQSKLKTLKTEDRYGTTGTPVELKANYFKLTKMPDFKLTQYRVDFEPELDVTQTRKKLITAWINENKSLLGNRYIFDGSSLYLSQFLESEIIIDTTFNGNPMKITIRQTRVIESDHPNAFQLFNLIFRESMAGLKLQNVRRDYFDPKEKIDIPMGNLELWPGYITSIREHENDVLMCSDILHKFMRKETIHDITRNLMKNDTLKWKEHLKKEIIGSTVLTEYTNKTYQIDDIDFTMTPQSTFTPAYKEDAVSYMRYYKTRYNIDIKDIEQFMLVSKSKERDLRAGKPDLIYLIPELCRATGMTDQMRTNFNLMSKLAEFTRLNPENRAKSLEKFNTRIQTTPESVNVLKEWNMELERELITVPARELPAEPIVFGCDAEVSASAKSDWTFRNSLSMYKTVPIVRWMCIFPETLRAETVNFIDLLKRAGNDMNCHIANPVMRGLNSERQDEYVSLIQNVAEKRPNIFFVVLPTTRADRYSAIKKVCFVDLGIPVQVATIRTMTHKNVGSIASKIAIQMNTKLGGMPWMIRLPVNGLMTVGFDVSIHPRDKSRSVGAMVATMDLKKTGVFFSVTSEHRDGNDMNNHLAANMNKALMIYKETCGALPDRILFYRDGVGEGQIQYIHKQEIEPLMGKLQRLYSEESSSPKLAYIVVNKRTNTRMFKRPKTGAGINPKPGTVVDRVITLPERNDFFLISQHVGQGTVSPTSYNIIFNNIGLNKDKLEILTYKFTHMYYNWSGTTRIPAVCQYAKKLAFLTSQSLQSPVHQNLERSLYFL